MKIEKLSAWTEMISSIAVLATLVYLVVQTNQNAEAIRANTRQQMLVTDMEFLRDVYNDPGITALQYQDELSDEEKAKLAAQYTMFLRQRESNWIQFQNGALDALTWNSMKSTLNVMAHQSNFHIYWRNLNANANAPGYAPKFVKIVDDIVQATPAGDRAVFLGLMDRPEIEKQQGTPQ